MNRTTSKSELMSESGGRKRQEENQAFPKKRSTNLRITNIDRGPRDVSEHRNHTSCRDLPLGQTCRGTSLDTVEENIFGITNHSSSIPGCDGSLSSLDALKLVYRFRCLGEFGRGAFGWRRWAEVCETADPQNLPASFQSNQSPN